MGLSQDVVAALSGNIWGWGGDDIDAEKIREIGLDPDEPTLAMAIALARTLIGFPRHLSQHVGGFVITRGPLSEMVPIENAAMPDRTVVEWDKDDIDAMGMLKVDVLGLGMLTCIRKAFELINQRHEGTESQRQEGTLNAIAPLQENHHVTDQDLSRSDCVAEKHGVGLPLQLHSIPPEDPAVYDMICKADTIGVFQIESRAQMSMLPRLRPRCYYDLVIEVAIVRPGPIQGDMVHPYLLRRCGKEKVEYPTPQVERVLRKTLGVPLFQEQAMALAIVAAGFTAGEADQLRRAMAAWKRKGDKILQFERKFIEGMLSRGYEREFAERCFRQLRGFSEYGFPESHAASFALLVYVSAWLKRHHPAVFAAALLNSQPMGFYAPAQIVSDARQHDVQVRPVDVNHSGWDCSIENSDRATASQEPAMRLGMRMIKGLREDEAKRIA